MNKDFPEPFPPSKPAKQDFPAPSAQPSQAQTASASQPKQSTASAKEQSSAAPSITINEGVAQAWGHAGLLFNYNAELNRLATKSAKGKLTVTELTTMIVLSGKVAGHFAALAELGVAQGAIFRKLANDIFACLPPAAKKPTKLRVQLPSHARINISNVRSGRTVSSTSVDAPLSYGTK